MDTFTDTNWTMGSQKSQQQPQTVPQSPMSVNSEIHRHLVNISIVRLHEFHDLMSLRMQGSTVEYRSMAMRDYFTPTAQVSLSLNLVNEPRHYTFSYCLMPHLSAEMASSHVKLDMSCKLVRAKVLQDGSTSLESPKLTIISSYPDGSELVHRGTLKVHITPDLRIEHYDMCVDSKSTMVDADILEKYIKDANANSTGAPGSNTTSTSTSEIPGNFLACSNSISKYGIQDSTLRLLQIADVMSLMKPLMTFHSNSGYDSPLKSFESFNANITREGTYKVPAKPTQDSGISPRTITPRDSTS